MTYERRSRQGLREGIEDSYSVRSNDVTNEFLYEKVM